MSQSTLDPKLAEKIVHEVKAQGVFDQFRKDSVADVDTKPAYQNLRQRVENAVQKFLSEQKWTPETNKHQLREKLRRHIVESSFFDVGVERIVDQVVNPKIGSVFQPRIEEIAYKYLGISPPLPTARRDPPPPPPMPLPPLPPFPPMNGSPLRVETNISNDLLPKDLEQISPDSDKMKDEDMMIDSAPIEEKADEDDESPPFEPLTECKSPKTEVKLEDADNVKSKIEPKNEIVVKNVKPEAAIKKENDAFHSHDSQLSQVSSDSRLSSLSNQLLNNGNETETVMETEDANICDEAQMPKFNENSTGTECSLKSNSQLHFDIKKDEIKFEGTERKSITLNGEIAESNAIVASSEYASPQDNIEKKKSFHFTNLNIKMDDSILNMGAVSSISSQDDTTSAQLCVVERPEDEMLSEMNSVQKPISQQEDSSTNNSQIKQSNSSKKDTNGKRSSASSTSSSRAKKLSSSSKDRRHHHHHSSEKDRKYSEKERHKSKHHERDRERYRERDKDRDKIRERERDRCNDSKHSSKISSSSSSRRHESSDKHKSSSRRAEKEQHVSSNNHRSESRSHNKSSKRDRRDKYEHKKSHKSSSSSKEHASEGQKSRTDDHNESREKRRRRKSTDSNDEDKNPNGHSIPNQTLTEPQRSNEKGSANANANSNENETDKNYKETNKDTSQSVDHIEKASNLSPSFESKSSKIVVLDAVLENPLTDFVEIENEFPIQTHKIHSRATTQSSESCDDSDLLYFEQTSDDEQFQTRLDLLNEAIDRCRIVIDTSDADTPQEAQQLNDEDTQDDDEHSTSKEATCQDDVMMRTDEIIMNHHQEETKATLLIDCFHYTDDCNDQNAVENMNISPKRLKYTHTDSKDISKLPEIPSRKKVVHVSTKLNQMKEKNSIMTEEATKKIIHPKREETLTKLSNQQRYSVQDLYKPRPVLGQRSKRRGVDSVT